MVGIEAVAVAVADDGDGGRRRTRQGPTLPTTPPTMAPVWLLLLDVGADVDVDDDVGVDVNVADDDAVDVDAVVEVEGADACITS